MNRCLCSAIVATTLVVLLYASPVSAWSSSDGSFSAWGGTHNGESRDIHLDSSGNMYTCGYLRGSGDVDPNYYDTTVVNEAAAGKQSSLVTKLNSSGNLVWSSLMDSSGDDHVDDCAIDTSGTENGHGAHNHTLDDNYDP